jgi:hypothetical protein
VFVVFHYEWIQEESNREKEEGVKQNCNDIHGMNDMMKYDGWIWNVLYGSSQ